MAIAPTGDIFKSLVFDGYDSRDYGIYITGAGVYNAPVRDVEMVSIAGRNGAFALDNGRFENITVTYTAGCYADTETEFAEAVSAFRNILASRSGYCRLTDDYNADEYRLAVYKSGLEVNAATLKAGEFSISFDCKPQRFLTSGETAVSVTSGDTLTNPTLFAASPLLLLDGYGTISVNSDDIEIENTEIGTTTLIASASTKTNTYAPTGSGTASSSLTVSIDEGGFETGDDFSIYTASLSIYTAPYSSSAPDSTSIVQDSSTFTDDTYTATAVNKRMLITISVPQIDFVIGTSASYTGSYTATGTWSGTSTDIAITYTVAYDGSGNITYTASTYKPLYFGQNVTISSGTADGYSTKSANVGLYIDLDLGECYTTNGGTISSVNSIISLGATLPSFPAGDNTITFDDTITSLSITPRWWHV